MEKPKWAFVNKTFLNHVKNDDGSNMFFFL